jgi:hypothetical protein
MQKPATEKQLRAAVWGIGMGLLGTPIIGGGVSGYVLGHPWIGALSGLAAAPVRYLVAGTAHLAQGGGCPRNTICVRKDVHVRRGVVAGVASGLVGAGLIGAFELHRAAKKKRS